MTIDEVHADVAAHLAEFERSNDPIQKGWRFTLAKPHVPVLLEERDTVARRIAETQAQLEAWGARMSAEHVDAEKQERRENDWYDGLFKLVELQERHAAAVGSLDAIGRMLTPPVEGTLPRW